MFLGSFFLCGFEMVCNLSELIGDWIGDSFMFFKIIYLKG